MGCLEPFYPPVEKYDDFLVVEGIITDQAKAQEIKLSRTFRLDKIMTLPETNAGVSLISDENAIHLEEVEPGIYKTNPFQFIGRLGATYQLSIITSDGNQYLSKPVVLKYVPPIDSIHWKWEEKTSLEEFGTLEHHEILQGVQLYVSTHDATDQTNYYRWDWVETYEFQAQFESLSKWDSDFRCAVPRNLPEEQIFRCWNTVHNSTIIIYNTDRLSTSQVSSFPINFVSNRTRRLQRRYSILVKQYALNAKGYTYFQDLKTISENSGSLFDAQPFQVYGNISNINNKDELVLGYFDASSVREHRIFIKNTDLDIKHLGLGDSCEKFHGDRSEYSRNRLKQGLDVVIDHESLSPSIITWTQRWCGDCTVEGVTKKPDFW